MNCIKEYKSRVVAGWHELVEVLMEDPYTLARVFAFMIVISAVVGWVMNIVKLLHLTSINTEFVFRVIAIFMSPVGCVAGYL